MADAQRRSYEIAARAQALCIGRATAPAAAVVLSAVLLGSSRGTRIADRGAHWLLFVFPRRPAP